MYKFRRSLGAITAGSAGLVMTLSAGLAGTAVAAPAPGDDAPTKLTPKGEIAEEFHGDEGEQGTAKLRDAYYWSRLLSGDDPIDLGQAARLRLKAARASNGIKASASRAAANGAGGGGTWTNQGPDPLVQVVRTSNTFAAMAGRVGALAIRKDGTLLVGGAQGGACGPTTRATAPTARGSRGPRTPTPSPSVRWPWRRATTTSSTWVPVRAASPATATTATASTAPPTAA
ncbi:hypothetical protein [Nocardioides ungokensis]|uniref:hypothetical protein n=1 Tax=Nocardioides ungokensis TaxID=1643322 RepID=UPI0015DF8530|nr:hypothetical protein [Nocardioides ungokensis]